MWRIFRLGIKSSSCSENQTHFRVIGTSYANENEDLVDDDECFGTLENIQNYEDVRYSQIKSSLASLAREKYSKKLNSIVEPITSDPEVSDIKNLLKKVQWEKYSPKSNKDVPAKKILFKKLNERSVPALSPSKEQTISEKVNIEDVREEIEFAFPTEIYGKRLSFDQYAKKMLALCRQRKLKAAIDVLEVEMVAQHVKPNEYCYNVLINACGKAGYCQKAFAIFHKMKQVGLTPGKFAYTGLFNSCANGPPETEAYCLRQAINLRKQIKDKEISLSPISYHAMIKAFGRLGEISTAFEIVDDMLIDKHRITTETMNFMLQACISDKEAGLRHAIKVWRRLRMLKLTPSIHSYNLMVRCIKECKGGDPKLLHEILETFPSKKNQKTETSDVKIGKEIKQILLGNIDAPPKNPENLSIQNMEDKYYQISANNERVEVSLQENMELEIISREDNVQSTTNKFKPVLPELLGRHFSKGQTIDLVSLNKPEERLALVGGPAGILSNMSRDRVRPTMATFTLMLESLPNSDEAEAALLSSIESCGVIPDIIFCNVLIRKRNMNRRFKKAKEVMDLMQRHRIDPDIVTFGTLAIGCNSPRACEMLLRDLKNLGIRPNENIMGTLLLNSLMKKEYLYALNLLKRMSVFKIKAGESTLRHLENARRIIRQTLLDQESQPDSKKNMTVLEKSQSEEMKVFLFEYKKWLKYSQVRLHEHPWAQYGHVEQPNHNYLVAQPDT